MSDSGDDWFDKDLDEFKVEKVESKIENISYGNATINKSINSDGSNDDAKAIGDPRNLFMDPDYGGNYNTSSSKASAKKKTTEANTHHIQPISYKKLINILEWTPLQIFLEVLQPNSGFSKTINSSSTSGDVILLCLKAIGQILTLPLIEYKKYILDELIDRPFWKQIEKCLTDSVADQPIKSSGKNNKKKTLTMPVINDRDLWENVVILCRNQAELSELNTKFVESIKKLIVKSKPELNLLKYADELTQVEKYFIERTSVLEIYPTLNELNGEAPNFLKPNIIKGQYPNVKEYLNIHLSLLREDFISPLREGILQFKKTVELGAPKSNTNIQYYPKVRVLSKQRANTRSHKGEFLMIDLEPDTRDAEQSVKNNDNGFTFGKKLMFGSLLILTENEQFENLILAVVSNRDTDMLNQGYIQIEIIKIYNVSRIFGCDFQMFESEVYFEPYHQVYKALSKLDTGNFPFTNYIINIDPTHTYPSYFPSTGRLVYTHRKNTLDMKCPSTWPEPSALQLNQNQLDAMKNALRNQFSLIHGPPGTGKTFIGLEIVSILLRNTEEQIFIICNTNQALDQFLMGILNFTEDIVRVGQQSKNEILDRFNIKQLTENAMSDKRMKSLFYKVKLDYVELMGVFEALQTQLDDQSVKNKSKIEKQMIDVQEQLRLVTRKQEELKQISDYYVLNSKRVIGMTSTWAARCSTLLQLLKPSIVIIEEAAELLESHIVAALTKDTKHVILIGDHQQLRPTTSVYKLAKQYNMDISLFERMITNGVNAITLNVQHRMRTEIANLIRPIIYKNLTDHESVLSYPKIFGIDKNLFFLNHSNSESKDLVETSKKNIYESQFLCAFCDYLILQGHSPEHITILTMYNGQLGQFSLERRKYPNLRNVRITVVDNYQGEENKIILLSLVRSNTNNNIGYLSMKNRIAVALSRAREGLFIAGNLDLLSSNSKTWKQIQAYLQEIGAIGDALYLRCQTHKNVTKISASSDLELMKFGGCQDCCGVPMECGHMCSLFCHTASFDHYSNCDCNVRN